MQHRDVATNATPGMAGHWDVYAGVDVETEDNVRRSAAARGGGEARSADVGYEGLEWLFSCPSGDEDAISLPPSGTLQPPWLGTLLKLAFKVKIAPTPLYLPISPPSPFAISLPRLFSPLLHFTSPHPP